MDPILSLLPFGRFSLKAASAYQYGEKKTRNTILSGIVVIVLGLIVVAAQLVAPSIWIDYLIGTGLVLIFIGIGMVRFGTALYEANEVEEEKREIQAKEKTAAENPDKPQLAWDLAKIRLEKYLERNLSQVRSIYLLAVISMTVGFGLIIYGSWKSFESPDNFQASIVVAISGVLVNIIGATFLVIYKSTMEQAKEYVLVLERINAVGMSVQIIDTISNNDKNIQDVTKAELAKKIIDLYNK